jgi:hypothetical protein
MSLAYGKGFICVVYGYVRILEVIGVLFTSAMPEHDVQASCH